MGKAFIQEETLTSIANAIRQKNLSNIKYKPAEMPAAILALTSFSDEQKQIIIDALAAKGVYVSIDELTLDNIATYILQIKVDSNVEIYIQIAEEYNELAKYIQERLNELNGTVATYSPYPNIDMNRDLTIQISEVTTALSELKEYTNTNLISINS